MTSWRFFRMRNGKFTSLALLSVFTVGFAQSSAVSAIVDSGSVETATKVSSGENSESDSTAKGNDNAETKGLSCTSPENGSKTVFISKDKKPQSSGGMSAGQVVSVAAVTFGVPGSILGAKKVVELVEKGENENPPSETSENSEQQSTSGSGTTSGQQGNNAGDLTVPADASIGSSKGNSNLGLYLLVVGIIVLVIVVVIVAFCFLNNAKKEKQKCKNEIAFAEESHTSNLEDLLDGGKDNTLLKQMCLNKDFDKEAKLCLYNLLNVTSTDDSGNTLVKIFTNFKEKGDETLANAFVFLLKDCNPTDEKALEAFFELNCKDDIEFITTFITDCYESDDEHSALMGLKFLLKVKRLF